MKKIIAFVLMFILIFPVCCFADEENNEEEEQIPELVEAASDSAEEPNLNSRAAIIYDRNSKEVIYGKEENTKRKMASTTKIMTCMVVLEKGELTDKVIVSKKAAGTGGSRVGLKTGDKVSVQDLLYGLMLCSGNDAAVALAEHVGGSVEGFADLMNEKARQLNLSNTHFVTPHGLDNEEHYTTAYELAIMADNALKNNTFSSIVGTKNITININGKPRNLSNTNELLGSMAGVYGVKTGFTNGANRCLVTSCKIENLDIITVVLGADTKKFRTQDSIKLINYAMNNYKEINMENKIQEEFQKWKKENKDKIYINKGEKNTTEYKLEEQLNNYITIKNTQENDVKIEINTLNYYEAPLQEGTTIGVLTVKVSGQVKLIKNIQVAQTVKKKNMINYMKELIEKSCLNNITK
jgi:D-alanyl-D-alanine carboxypeptidase (penicillin-binding protein 5/6)